MFFKKMTFAKYDHLCLVCSLNCNKLVRQDLTIKQKEFLVLLDTILHHSNDKMLLNPWHAFHSTLSS